MSEEQPNLLHDAPPPAETLSIFALLARRFPAGEWAYFEEVRQKPSGGRSADAVAMNLWSSRGYAVCGFEVKVSRSDWLREKRDGSKAEPIFQFCDRWALVTEKGVVKDGEVPDTWGHIEKRGQTLFEVKAAPKLTPKPLSREFFASLMRRGHETLERRAAVMVQLQAHEEQNKMKARRDEEIRRSTRSHEEYKARVEQFFKATGLEIDSYRGIPDAKAIAYARKLMALKNWKGEDLGRLAELATKLDDMSRLLKEVAIDPAFQVSGPVEDGVGDDL